jgi:ABC-type glycerol-3-phosphate transport system substrate-binding protein
MVKLAALLAALALAVSGCSQAEDTADRAAQQAADAASARAAEAAAAAKEKAAQEAAKQIGDAKARASQGVANAIRAQLCALTADGSVGPADLAALPPLLDRAAQAGVAPELVTPLRAAVAQGRAAKAQVQRAQAACRS